MWLAGDVHIKIAVMSHSDSSDEFSYQTRLVVYNFFGLVPATPQSDDELENSQNEALLHEKPTASRSDALEDLPTLSLIDRLSESEVAHMQMKMVCNEVADKVRLVEPTPSSSSASESSSKPTDALNGGDKKYRAVSYDGYDHEVAHQALLNELKQVVVTRGVSPLSAGNEEASSAPITVIQRRNRLIILGDGITASEEADIYQHRPLQPFAAASAKPYDTPSSYSAAKSQSLPATFGGSGTRPFIPRRPTTLLPSSGLASLRETLRQIDEDHELNTASGTSAEGGALPGQDREVSVTTPIHSFTFRGGSITPVSFERQSSTLSSSSRRHSTYVDITEVDIENLVRAKSLPPVTLPLKMELSAVFEELEKSHKTGTKDFSEGADVDAARSPESEVADSLRALGDRIQDEYGTQLSLIVRDLLSAVPEQHLVNYAALQNAALQLLRETQDGWTRATLMMLLGQRVIYELIKKGYSGISYVAEFTAKLVEDHAADFIIDNGGWNSISDIGVETVTVSTPLDGDFRLSEEIYTNYPPRVESSSVYDVRTSELSDVRTSGETVDSENDPEIFGSLSMDSSCLRASEGISSSSEAGTEFVPGSLLLLSPADVVQPKNDGGAEAEFLRQDSQQYVDEMDAVQSTVAWSQPGAVAGFVLMAVLISWILYQRVRRTT